MKIEQNLLINELVALIEQAIEATKNFKLLPEISLNYKKNSSEWSILECLEHLNLYGEFYLPEIEKQLLESSSKNHKAIFKSGILGNYFANLMKENKGKIKKLKSPKDKDPINSNLSVTTIDCLLIQLDSLKFLLNQSNNRFSKCKSSYFVNQIYKIKTWRYLAICCLSY